jgi:hypothetical protein
MSNVRELLCLGLHVNGDEAFEGVHHRLLAAGRTFADASADGG